MRVRRALYSLQEGPTGSNPMKGCTLSTQQSCLLAAQKMHPTVTTVGSPTVATVGIPTVLERVGSDPDTHTRRPDSKRTRPGREPEPEPRPRPEPEPGPDRHRRRQPRRARARAGIDPSQSRAKTPSTQRARPLFSIFFIYTPQTSISRPMWD